MILKIKLCCQHHGIIFCPDHNANHKTSFSFFSDGFSITSYYRLSDYNKSGWQQQKDFFFCFNLFN